MSKKITHLKTCDDGWWRNMAVDSDSQPRALGLGLVTLAPGATRFVDARTVARSGGAFTNALAAGLIAGPFPDQAAAAGGVVKPVPVAVDEPKVAEPPEPPVAGSATVSDNEPKTVEAPAPGQGKRRR